MERRDKYTKELERVQVGCWVDQKGSQARAQVYHEENEFILTKSLYLE